MASDGNMRLFMWAVFWGRLEVAVSLYNHGDYFFQRKAVKHVIRKKSPRIYFRIH